MIDGVGLGFRRDLSEGLINLKENKPRFIELAPENWMGMGGYWGKQLHQATELYPLLCHGLSLSIGSPEPLDMRFLKELKQFFNEFNPLIYSEHLSYSKSQNAHLYDLLPIPFTEDAVEHIVDRIRTVQDYLERPLALENVSYYTEIGAEMDEAEFITRIIDRSGCNLLLDVNNVYVNAFNHHYNAKEFIKKLPLDKVVYIHMAGHEKVRDDLIIDTHGQPIIDPVYDLFEWTLHHIEPVPILLERDFNIPDLEVLQNEISHLQTICDNVWEVEHAKR